MEIIPAILPTSAADLAGKLARLAPIKAISVVQIDAVDGTFASPASWPYKAGEQFPKALPSIERFRFDLDLMIGNPHKEAERFATAGASRLTIHAESAIDLPELLAHLRRKLGFEASFAPGLLSIGLAIGIETPLSLIEPHVKDVEYVQLMGIAHIGRQHEPFDTRVLARIEALHKQFPDLPIQIDGGVSLTTAPELLEAGATRLVVGSALFDTPDLAARYAEFRALQ